MADERELGRLAGAVEGLQRDVSSFCENVDRFHERIVVAEKDLDEIKRRLDKGAQEIGSLRDGSRPSPEQIRAEVVAEEARKAESDAIRQRLAALEGTKAIVVDAAQKAGGKLAWVAAGSVGAALLEGLKWLVKAAVAAAGG